VLVPLLLLLLLLLLLTELTSKVPAWNPKFSSACCSADEMAAGRVSLGWQRTSL
jgi:hypothetical protein